MSERVTFYKFVRWQDVPAHEAHGWRIDFDLGPTHGQWSVGMIWTLDSEPPSTASLPRVQQETGA